MIRSPPAAALIAASIAAACGRSQTKYFCRGDSDCGDAQLHCVEGRCKPRCQCPSADGICIGEVCSAPLCLKGAPKPETCNGIDDDCDGTVDEDDPGGGGSCLTGRPGVCGPGVFNCLDGRVQCAALAGSREQCNGLDDNCDGAVDNAPEGTGAPCTSDRPPPCGGGERVCRQGSWACVPKALDVPESCNGGDDNCNGVVDEGAPGSGWLCDTGQPGRCAAGITRCIAGGIRCEQTQFPIPEACNGADDDCDGRGDEDNPGGGQSCQTGRPGPCGPGTTECANGVLLCRQVTQPKTEVCGNGVDEDCDGRVDSGLACAGCSDETREGFLDRVRFKDIAGCAGGFGKPGVLTTTVPDCSRKAGNDSQNPDGKGCTVADLCAAGWHVCASEAEVRQTSPVGCAGVPASPQLFFVTRQSGPGCLICATGTSTDPIQCTSVSCQRGCLQTNDLSNDVFGCGNVGATADATSCGALDRCSHNLCGDLPAPWTCGTDGSREAHNVRKTGPSVGGAMCCRD